MLIKSVASLLIRCSITDIADQVKRVLKRLTHFLIEKIASVKPSTVWIKIMIQFYFFILHRQIGIDYGIDVYKRII